MENCNLTVGDCGSPKTHRYLMKVYKIRITSYQKGGIWYTRKVGQEFHAILAYKINKIPVFRLVDVNDSRTYLTVMALVLDVYPSDCKVVDEFIVRSSRSLEHLYV